MSSPKPWPYTLAETYLRYRQRDGERVLFPDVEAKYGDVAADTITYDVLRKWASEFFPKLNKDEREILFVWSMAEILGWRQAEPRSQVAAEDKDPYPYDWAEIDYYGEVIYRDRGGRHWASISKAPGPPPDPGPREYNHYKAGTPRQWEAWDYRGQFSKSRLKDGAQVFPGPTPKGKKSVYAPDGKKFYIGYVLGKSGRPRKPNALSGAERARRFRERHRKK